MNLRAGIFLTLIAGALAWYAWTKPMDFRVYHYGARGVFDGSRPVYGVESGLGWPMHYRYPPLFLLLFAPFAWLPLGVSAACWVIAKLAVLALLIRSMRKRFPPKNWIVPVLLAGPFVIQDFRYGNAQFFVFALTAFALLLARERPLLSAGALSLGIAIKVWPAFFVPYLLVRKDWKVATWTLALTVVLTIVPSLYFGVGRNASLIGQWFRQEFATQTGKDEIWFPSQSLRGVLMRYLTVIDYSQVPDSNYRLVHVAAVDPQTVRVAWAAAAAAIYTMFLGIVYRRSGSDGWTEAGLGFCLVGLLEPFTQKYALVVLLWPAMIVAGVTDRPVVRNLIYIAIGIVLIQPLIPGSNMQRWMQVLGLDFAATLATALALVLVLKLPHARSGTV